MGVVLASLTALVIRWRRTRRRRCVSFVNSTNRLCWGIRDVCIVRGRVFSCSPSVVVAEGNADVVDVVVDADVVDDPFGHPRVPPPHNRSLITLLHNFHCRNHGCRRKGIYGFSTPRINHAVNNSDILLQIKAIEEEMARSRSLPTVVQNSH